MFKNSYQNGLLSIFYSCGANPLAIWDMEVNNGHVKRLTDREVNSVVLEIVSTNVATTYITCPPKSNQVLGITLPFLVMIIKNLKRYFSFEITILDDKNMRRRFRISNFQSTTKIKPFCTSMPIGLACGWNQIQFNLADFTRRAYGTQFVETLRVQIHANIRLRRIYFCERLFSEEELPQDYKLYLPFERKNKPEIKKPEVAKAAQSPLKMSKKSGIPKTEPKVKEEPPTTMPVIKSETKATASSEGEKLPKNEDAAAAEQVSGAKDETVVKEEGVGEPAGQNAEKSAEADAEKPAKADAENPAEADAEKPAEAEADKLETKEVSTPATDTTE